MTALQTDSHSNVLSAPTLLTADNEEAMIVVGQNVPFVGSASANSGLPGQIFNSVDRQNVGITLDIVPQVSQGEYVRLDLYEEVSNVVPAPPNSTLGPTTTIRSASTTVLVQNHRTAVVGGLISSDAENARQGVPFLSDIPVLGNLFSDNSRQLTKQNLLVFLTPHIVRTREDLQALSLDERQKYVRTLAAPKLTTCRHRSSSRCISRASIARSRRRRICSSISHHPAPCQGRVRCRDHRAILRVRPRRRRSVVQVRSAQPPSDLRRCPAGRYRRLR